MLNPRTTLIAAVAIALWSPVARLEWLSAHEQASYILRTVEWTSEFRNGVLFPRWCPDFYGGFGSPFFVFYAPLTYAAAGVLSATFLDPISALKVVALGASLLAGFGMYALVVEETRDRDAALLASLAYLACPYRVANLLQRGDIAEFLAMAILPVVITLYRRSAHALLPRRASLLAAAAAGAHALLLLTHPISGLWGSFLVGAIVFATAVRLTLRGLRRRALILIGAMACAPGLVAFYIVPAIAYRSASHAAGMIVGFYSPLHQWIHLHSLFDEQAIVFSPNFLRVGPLLVAALATAALGIAFDVRKGRAAVGWVLLTIVFVALTTPEMSWFWVPGRVPLVNFTQFPWRLLGLASLTACVAMGIGASATLAGASESLRGATAIAAGAAMLLTMPWPHLSPLEMKTDSLPLSADAIRKRIHSTTDAEEYLPRDVPHVPRQPRYDLVVSASSAVASDALSDGSRHWLTVQADHPGATVVLGLHAFPGWKVATTSGSPPAVLESDPQGLLRVRFPRAGAFHLRIWFGYPTAAWIGFLMSLLASVGLAALILPPGTLPRLRFARRSVGGEA